MEDAKIVPMTGADLKRELQKIDLPPEIQHDLDKAREDIREIAKIGIQAVAEAASLADSSQNDRMYVALSSLMKSALEANKELIETYRTEKDLRSEDPDAPQHVTNQLVMTTDQVLEMIMQGNKTNDEEQ